MTVIHETLPQNPHWVQLYEQCNEIPELRLKYAPGIVSGRGFAGTDISLIDDGQSLFSGVIAYANTLTGDVIAKSQPVVRHLAQRGLSVYSAAIEPTAIFALGGFQDRFGWVQWRQLAQVQCGCLCQYRESDWQFARRVAALDGGYLVVNPGDGAVVGHSRHDEETHLITLADVSTGSDHVIESLVHASTKFSGWNVSSSSNCSARAAPEHLSASENAIHQFINQFALDDNELSAVPTLTVDQVQSLADRDSRLIRGASELWGARLLDRNEISLNHRLDLADDLGGGSYTVWQRTVTYVAGEKYLDIQCRNAKAGFPELLELTRNTATILVFGVVVNANDPQRLGRVRVQLAAQSANQAVWCHSLQPHLGVCQVPSQDDQVAVLLEPNCISFPLCLGAVFHSRHAVPEQVKNPATEKLIFDLSGAVSLLAKNPGGIVELKSDTIKLTITSQGVSITRG